MRAYDIGRLCGQRVADVQLELYSRDERTGQSHSLVTRKHAIVGGCRSAEASWYLRAVTFLGYGRL